MTGPEHYREAQLLLQTTDETDHYRAYRLRAAQVHATLALAAATALNDRAVGMTGRDHGEWLAAAATKPEATL